MPAELQAGAAPLSNLPIVALETVLQSLDLASIKNLRLTSRVLGENCVGPQFKSFFRHPKTDLSQHSLRNLDALISNLRLGSAVESVTLVAVVYDFETLEEILTTKRKNHIESRGGIRKVTYSTCSKEELVATREELDWMHARQREYDDQHIPTVADELASILKKLGQLKSLRLDASCVQGLDETRPISLVDELVPVSISASRVFSIATLAMAKSRVNVGTLEVFKDAIQCSVQSADITNHMVNLEDGNFSVTGQHIKELALSFSTRVYMELEEAGGVPSPTEFPARPRYDYQLDIDENPHALAPDNFPGVAGMLGYTPNLEALDLHMYQTAEGNGEAYSQLFTRVAKDVQLPALERVVLRGLYVKGEDLLLFLTNHPNIKTLHLLTISLSDSWEPIFAHLSSMPALEYLWLSALRGDGKTVNLDPEKEKFSQPMDHRRINPTSRFDWYPLGGASLVHTREIYHEELREGLHFKPSPRGGLMGSGRTMRFHQSQTLLYGRH